MSASSYLLISSATPRSHDQGIWQLCRVMRLPVPMLMGKKLMGVFSLLVPHGSLVLLEWGLATGATPKPPNIDLQESNYLPGKKGSQITSLTMQHWTLQKLQRLPLCASALYLDGYTNHFAYTVYGRGIFKLLHPHLHTQYCLPVWAKHYNQHRDKQEMQLGA